MMRVMLDSDRLDIILSCNGLADVLATYSDLVPAPEVLQSKLTHSKLVLIDRGMGDPSGKASIGDVERGAMTIEQVPGWLKKKEAQGIVDRTIYVDRSNLAAVDEVAKGLSFFRGVATLDGNCSVAGFPSLRGPAFVQVLPASLVGIHADLSLIFEDQWNGTREISAADVLPVEHAVATALMMLHNLTG